MNPQQCVRRLGRVGQGMERAVVERAAVHAFGVERGADRIGR
ncbi:MAG TPA: hypothetical protein VF158_08720 [Longimicrobiales bacterium]